MPTFLRLTFVLLYTSLTLATRMLVERQPQPANVLVPRQGCPSGYNICLSNNGDGICAAAGDLCCQLVDGSSPFSCPSGFPYCCGYDAVYSLYICGSDQTCSGPLQLPTVTVGTTYTAAPASTVKAQVDTDTTTVTETAAAASGPTGSPSVGTTSTAAGSEAATSTAAGSVEATSTSGESTEAGSTAAGTKTGTGTGSTTAGHATTGTTAAGKTTGATTKATVTSSSGGTGTPSSGGNTTATSTSTHNLATRPTGAVAVGLAGMAVVFAAAIL